MNLEIVLQSGGKVEITDADDFPILSEGYWTVKKHGDLAAVIKSKDVSVIHKLEI